MSARERRIDPARRQLLAALPLAAAWPLARAARLVPAPALPLAASLPSELGAALLQRKALVALVSLEGCPYCELVRRNYLVHLRAQGQPVVQLEMARDLPLVGFDGQAATHAALVRAWKVKVAPTVLFFGRGGVELAERLAGVAVPDFYGAYLDQRIAQANRSVG